MQIKNKNLFGFPIIKTKINKTLYDKKNIINTIEENYKINNKRNNWDDLSILHHVSNDWKNTKFKKINFNKIIPVYKDILQKTLNKLNFICKYSFKFVIVNYTCLNKHNFMQPHIHPKCHFTAVHYLQFDKNNHTGTRYHNTLPFIEHLGELAPELLEISSKNDFTNSWLCGSWREDVEEDDFYLYPSFLKHSIDPQKSKNKKRMTIILNITLKKQKDNHVYK